MTSEWLDNPDYYYTDAIVDYGLKFVKESNPDKKPFYLYLAFTAAHWPLHARPADIEHYKGRYAMGWDELRKQRHEKMKKIGVVDSDWELSPRNEEVPAWEDEEHKEWQQRRMEVYAAQITSMDRNIGRIVDYLKETRQFDNTVIFYHHDNGGCHVEYGEKRTGSWTRETTTDGKSLPVRPGNIPGVMPGPQTTFQSYGYGWANASNTPFRYYKQYDHEGGTRSPLIVSWPKGVAHQKAGGMAHAVCHAIDVMPTFLQAAGVKLPQHKPFPFEGRSFLGTISGGPFSEDRSLFWSHNKGRAVRSGNWKLVATGKEKWELYNLSMDGTELNNVAAEHPARVDTMKAQFDRWMKRTDIGRSKKKQK